MILSRASFVLAVGIGIAVYLLNGSPFARNYASGNCGKTLEGACSTRGFVDVTYFQLQLANNRSVTAEKMVHHLISLHLDRLVGSNLRERLHVNVTVRLMCEDGDSGVHTVICGNKVLIRAGCVAWGAAAGTIVFHYRFLYQMAHESFHAVAWLIHRFLFKCSSEDAVRCLTGATYEAQAEWAALVLLRFWHTQEFRFQSDAALDEQTMRDYISELFNLNQFEIPSAQETCITAATFYMHRQKFPYSKFVALLAITGDDFVSKLMTSLIQTPVEGGDSWLCDNKPTTCNGRMSSTKLWCDLYQSGTKVPWILETKRFL